MIFEDSAVKSVEAGYLKLYGLSTGKAALRSLKLDGIFGALHNCGWSAGKPYELDYLRANEIEMKLSGEFPHIEFVDKFPRFLQHIIPADNTRILDTTKVRFGAQLGAGTTVMPGASYINFNAGTLGKSMIEGRVSSSAVVGEGSDVGGGGSILGVLSGTNGNPITIGENCLVGANSVCGIPMGDGSIIDAGIAILEGTKISVPVAELEKIKEANGGETPKGEMKGEEFITKGSDIGGFKGVHFRQNSTNGKIMAFRSKREIKLNEALH
jgi:2,3,4,5-tetrahydropyridine-2-carboxylate N-succinyltransferase